MLFRFNGGVHPDDKKSPANTKPVTNLAPPPQLSVPMSLHIGAPCTPAVSVGDKVLLGQVIGSTEAPVSAPIHSPVSGTVSAIEPRLHANGTMVTSVVIDSDGNDTPHESIKPADAKALEDPDAVAALIRSAGIVGMGGATFPTAFKITSGRDKVDTVIINGAECEPYIASDHRTMLEHPEELLKGIKLIMTACKVSAATLAIEENKKDAVKLLGSKNPEGMGIKILPLPTRYPQGAEKQLVQTVTGKEIPPGKLPADVGCAVFNCFTAYSVYRAAYEGMPVIERVVTVSGSAVETAQNLNVRIGTPLSYIFDHAGGFKSPPFKVLMGGPMMGNAMYSLDVSVTKGTNALLAFSGDEDRTVKNPHCIRCGKCAEACPMRLLPMYLYMFEEKNDFANMDKFHLTDCIECGACTYACPAKLHLTHSCRTGKAKIAARAAAEKAKAQQRQEKHSQKEVQSNVK